MIYIIRIADDPYHHVWRFRTREAALNFCRENSMSEILVMLHNAGRARDRWSRMVYLETATRAEISAHFHGQTAPQWTLYPSPGF